MLMFMLRVLEEVPRPELVGKKLQAFLSRSSESPLTSAISINGFKCRTMLRPCGPPSPLDHRKSLLGSREHLPPHLPATPSNSHPTARAASRDVPPLEGADGEVGPPAPATASPGEPQGLRPDPRPSPRASFEYFIGCRQSGQFIMQMRMPSAPERSHGPRWRAAPDWWPRQRHL